VSEPQVSVYLPTRNRAGLLREAAESVLAQHCRELELIIVDDASEDETPEVAESLARRDPRVRYLRQPMRRGAPAARNRAIAETRGRFVTGIDDDDLMLPGRLASLLQAHDERHALVCSGFLLERGGWRKPMFASAREIDLDRLLYSNIVGNQALVLTERVRAIGGFDENLVASQDYDLWTRLVAQFGPARRIAEPSYVCRQDAAPESISASPRAGQGAAQYAAKHAGLMNAAQRRSQWLLQVIASRRPLRLVDFPAGFTTPTVSLLLRYWLAGLPAAETLQQRYRRLRWGLRADS
jgi:glycosyltransferase involved in cell wall biosynthesis